MLPAKPFYLLRHGQSVANVTHTCAGGQTDSPLSELGHEQGKALAKVIDQLELKPEVIYHSFMQRAHNTAKYVNETLKLEMINSRDLREHDVGEFDGRPDVDVWPMIIRGDKPKGGESRAEFSQRIQATITDILTKEERLPLLVAHGGVFHAIGLLYEYGLSSIQNCHLHYFEPDGSTSDTFPWRVWMFDIEGDKLVKKEAPIFLSLALNKIA